MQRYEPHKTVLKKWPKKCINKSNFLQITTKTEINFYWYFFQNCTFFRILEQKCGGYVLNFHFVIDTISAVLYFLCCMLCLFRLSDSDDVLAALYLAADILQKKTSGKKLKSKILLLLLFFRERQNPPKMSTDP